MKTSIGRVVVDRRSRQTGPTGQDWTVTLPDWLGHGALTRNLKKSVASADSNYKNIHSQALTRNIEI